MSMYITEYVKGYFGYVLFRIIDFWSCEGLDVFNLISDRENSWENWVSQGFDRKDWWRVLELD